MWFLQAASLICADPLNLMTELNQLIESNVDLIHFDVMDGHFVPRYGLYPEILKEIKKKKNCPEVDVHMMVSNPEDYIERHHYCISFDFPLFILTVMWDNKHDHLLL